MSKINLEQTLRNMNGYDEIAVRAEQKRALGGGSRRPVLPRRARFAREPDRSDARRRAATALGGVPSSPAARATRMRSG